MPSSDSDASEIPTTTDAIVWVPCPSCQQPSAYAAHNRWRPFCSQRCRMIDLGAWASGDYRMASSPSDPGRESSSELDSKNLSC